MQMSNASDLPVSAGVGFKPEHFGEIVAAAQPMGFFEIHAENYMGAGRYRQVRRVGHLHLQVRWR